MWEDIVSADTPCLCFAASRKAGRLCRLSVSPHSCLSLCLFASLCLSVWRWATCLLLPVGLVRLPVSRPVCLAACLPVCVSVSHRAGARLQRDKTEGVADGMQGWVELVEETGGDPPEKAAKLVLDIIEVSFLRGLGPSGPRPSPSRHRGRSACGRAGQGDRTGEFLWIDEPMHYEPPFPESWDPPPRETGPKL